MNEFCKVGTVVGHYHATDTPIFCTAAMNRNHVRYGEVVKELNREGQHPACSFATGNYTNDLTKNQIRSLIGAQQAAEGETLIRKGIVPDELKQKEIGLGNQTIIPNEAPYKNQYILIAIVFGFIVIGWFLLMSNIVKG